MGNLSTFLFARPSFCEGVARAIDLGGTLDEYNVSPSGEIADAIAFSADWRQVAEDMWAVILRERAAGVEAIPAK